MVLEFDRHRLVVIAVDGRVGQAQAVIDNRLAILAESVQRAVHQVFELIAVVN
jgi:hypothetical protein